MSCTCATKPDPRLVADLAEFGAQALAVVRDRRDLCLLLLDDEPVTRGDIAIPLTEGDSPARLVDAIVLARHLGDAEAEQRALAKLERKGAEEDPDTGNTYRELVAYWGAVYRPLVPVPLDDVAAKKAVLVIRDQ